MNTLDGLTNEPTYYILIYKEEHIYGIYSSKEAMEEAYETHCFIDGFKFAISEHELAKLIWANRHSL